MASTTESFVHYPEITDKSTRDYLMKNEINDMFEKNPHITEYPENIKRAFLVPIVSRWHLTKKTKFS